MFEVLLRPECLDSIRMRHCGLTDIALATSRSYTEWGLLCGGLLLVWGIASRNLRKSPEFAVLFGYVFAAHFQPGAVILMEQLLARRG